MTGTDDGQLSLFGDTEAAAEPPGAAVLATGDERVHVAEQLGRAHQDNLESLGTRKELGAWYTPSDVVEFLLDVSLQPRLDSIGTTDELAAFRVLDPACGSGNFLVAAAHRIAAQLMALGCNRADSVRTAFGACVVGVDIDPLAVENCRAALSQESGSLVTITDLSTTVVHSDSLALPLAPVALALDDGPAPASWDELMAACGAARGFDLVIGNPPFLNQLETKTAATSAELDNRRRHFGHVAGAYTDPAALFLYLAVNLIDPDQGEVCLIEPTAVLSTKDSAGVRAAVAECSVLRHLWIANDRVFDAAVDVCALHLRRGAAEGPVTLLVGRPPENMGEVAAPTHGDTTWASLLAAAHGLPDAEIDSRGTLADIAAATADFRDQYYGLAEHTIDQETADDTQLPRLVTAGLIDPAELLWGARTTKFNKSTYQHPRVRIADLEPKLQRWATNRMVPKVLLATQTGVLEPFVDDVGCLLPSVPVITITASTSDLWKIGALLASPPVTLVAARRHFGAALSADALKLSASDVLALPLPADADAWCAAAECFRTASAVQGDAKRQALSDSAQLMCKAFRIADPAGLMAWWTDRIWRRRERS